ncbi:MAG: cytochrome c oxidase subunit 3 [Rhizomicrobium sp.]
MNVKHDYHLAEPSPWPFLGGLSAFIIALGGVLWLNTTIDFFGLPPFICRFICLGGAVLLAFTLVGWWRDMVAESVHASELSPVVKLSLRFAMALVMLIEAVYFSALLWVYLDVALSAEAQGGWPPVGIHPADPWHLPLLALFVLLLSATTVVWARRAIAQSHKSSTIQALGVSVFLAAGGLALLIGDLSHLPFGFGFNHAVFMPLTDPAHINLIAVIGSPGAIYGSLFILIMGSFCVHLALGTVFLTVALVRAVAGHFRAKGHFGFEAAAWFWHFGILLWLLLYAGLYIGGAYGGHGHLF